MKNERKKMPNELGECDVGDIIQGGIYAYKLRILRKHFERDDLFSYDCQYIEGPRVGETTSIMSYFEYKKVTL